MNNKLFIWIFVLLFLCLSVKATDYTHTYNFSDYINNTAYYGSYSTLDLWAIGNNASVGQYSNMTFIDNISANSSSSNSNYEPYWRFNFTINKNISTINKIDVNFLGYKTPTATESGTCYIYNFSASNWIATSYLSTSNSWINTSYTSNLSSLINNTKFVVACVGYDFDNNEGIFVDYVEVKINYTITNNSGCEYHNPDCNLNETCVNNTCVFNGSSQTINSTQTIFIILIISVILLILSLIFMMPILSILSGVMFIFVGGFINSPFGFVINLFFILLAIICFTFSIMMYMD